METLNHFSPLVHKKTKKPYSDVDYLELLGRRCIKMDSMNNSGIPTDYGYDLDVVNLAKEVVKAIEANIAKPLIVKYVNNCIK